MGYTYKKPAMRQAKFVGRLVREAMLARDLTPLEASRQAGVSRTTFYRWVQGDMSGTAIRVIDWLMHDPSNSHDAFYWRERALLAEEALESIRRRIDTHQESRDEIVKDDVNGKKWIANPRRLAPEHNGASH